MNGSWARKRMMNQPFNMARTAEDRRVYVREMEAARREVAADPTLAAACSRWSEAWHARGNRAGFPSFAAWRAQQSN